MAVNLNPAFKYRSDSVLSESMQYRRKKGRVKIKKAQRKKRLRIKHIVICFILQLGIFVSIQQGYLFLISWDNLNITKIEVSCHKPAIKKEIQQYLNQQKLGNILLLDIGHLQEMLSMHRWIKEVQIRKLFPPALKIDIEERIPAAVLKKEAFHLIDREGVLIEQHDSKEYMELPLLIDSNNFEKDYKAKINLAWECLDNFAPTERKKIDVLDLSGFENVKVKFRDSPTWIIFGNDLFSEKLQSVQTRRASLKKYGELEYIDLRFKDRLIIMPTKKLRLNDILSLEKEEN